LRISKIFIGLLLVFGNLFALDECSSVSYHEAKKEFNLDSPKFSELSDYSAEVFTSKHIYSIDVARDLNEEFQFGSINKAKLIKYTNDDTSGLTAGVYLINNKNIVIAFGGTTANEKYNNLDSIADDIIDDLKDIYDDLKLLNNNGESSQTSKSRIFMNEVLLLLKDMNINNNNVTITGHSLGGGLAQYASMYTGFKAITFNTAPNPLTYKSIDALKDEEGKFISDGSNIVNFMTNKDELTYILKVLEAYANTGVVNLTGVSVLDKYLIEPEIKKLQTLMNRPTEGLKKLIYGSRIVLNTNTHHFMYPLILNSYSNVNNYFTFTDSNFADISTSSQLSCALLVFLKNHIISYPKKSRDYKFYPNAETNWNEVSTMVVNSFLYKEYRDAESKNNGLTRLEYLKNFNTSNVFIQKNASVKVEELNKILREIFKYRISKTITSKKFSETLNVLLKNWDNYNLGLASINKLSTTSLLTRGQAAIIVYKTNKKDWESYIKEEWTIQKSRIEGKGVINGFKRLFQLDDETLDWDKPIPAVRG